MTSKQSAVPETVAIIGATSAIAQACARRFAEHGADLFLAGRDSQKLAAVADDLRVRGARHITVHAASLEQTDTHEELLAALYAAYPRVDVVLIAYGVLGEQRSSERDFSLQHSQLQVNFISVCSLLTAFALRFEQAGRGTIAVISSVAGDRGRQSNYIYGAAKAALSVYLQGLRNRLFKKGVAVVTIKPGFIDTPMTAGMKKGPLFASPDRAARAILRAIRRGDDVAYVPWFWRWIMLVITLIPERLFKRLRL